MANAEIIWFSRRERQILPLLCDRQSNKEIAEFLGISAFTVRWHVSSLLEKLGIQDRMGLIAWCFQHEEALVAGNTRCPGLHRAGCGCGSGWCSGRRRMLAA